MKIWRFALETSISTMPLSRLWISSAPTMAPGIVPDAARERRAADHGRGDHVELGHLADRMGARVQARGRDHRGDRRERAHQHEDDQQHALGWQPREQRRLRIAAVREHVASEARALRDERERRGDARRGSAPARRCPCLRAPRPRRRCRIGIGAHHGDETEQRRAGDRSLAATSAQTGAHRRVVARARTARIDRPAPRPTRRPPAPSDPAPRRADGALHAAADALVRGGKRRERLPVGHEKRCAAKHEVARERHDERRHAAIRDPPALERAHRDARPARRRRSRRATRTASRRPATRPARTRSACR